MHDKVYILGCGPAGLLAAHAADLQGYDPVIVSRKVKSEIGGAQYLHKPIPGLSIRGDSHEATFVKVGEEGGYAEKVYKDPNMNTSWAVYEEGVHRVWNMRHMYDILWSMYKDEIHEHDVNPEYASHLGRKHIVISTIPKPAVCPDPQNYDWRSQEVWIRYGTDVEDVLAEDMQIVMSGDKSHRWYRQSNLFGWKGVEFPCEVGGSIKVSKPISTTYPGVPGVLHLGRYGEWRKTVLVHDVFFRAHQYLADI